MTEAQRAETTNAEYGKMLNDVFHAWLAAGKSEEAYKQEEERRRKERELRDKAWDSQQWKMTDRVEHETRIAPRNQQAQDVERWEQPTNRPRHTVVKTGDKRRPVVIKRGNDWSNLDSEDSIEKITKISVKFVADMVSSQAET